MCFYEGKRRMDSGERHDIHCEEELERKRLRAIANYGVAQFCPNIQTQKAIELLEDALAISISQQQPQQQCFRRHSVDVPQFQTPDSLRRCAELVEQSLDRNFVFDHGLILDDLLHGYEG